MRTVIGTFMATPPPWLPVPCNIAPLMMQRNRHYKMSSIKPHRLRIDQSYRISHGIRWPSQIQETTLDYLPSRWNTPFALNKLSNITDYILGRFRRVKQVSRVRPDDCS